MRHAVALALVGLLMVAANVSAADKADEGWIRLFDGKTFDGWKAATENPDTWKIQDGALVCHGDRCHLFYVGKAQPFKNFHFKADVMTTPGSNSGIYFDTAYQETGWPKQGFECQVNISHPDPIKTGSLYQVVNVSDPLAKDNEWWKQEIIVEGKHVVVKINGKTVVDYTEPEGKKAGADFTRVLDKGTFALQGHDPKSTVSFKNIEVKRLP